MEENDSQAERKKYLLFFTVDPKLLLSMDYRTDRFRRDFVLHSVGISQDVLDTDTVMSFIQLPSFNTFICQKM